MTLKPRFFYNTGAEEGAGGNVDAPIVEKSETVIEDKKPDTPTPPEEIKVDPPKEIPQEVISDEELKSYGFNSKEELRNFLAKQKEGNLSEDEKKEKDNLEKANFLKFSADNKLLNVDEYNKYETLKTTADKDLVFEKYLAEYKEDHPEIDDEKLAEAAEEEFELEYRGKRGEAKLAKEAKEIRTPFESKITEAQNQFKENNSLRETYPKFEQFVDKAIVKNTPDKLVAYKHKEGEAEVEIDIPLTQADRDAIAKAFKTPKTFALFTNGKPEEIQEVMDNKIQGWLFQNKRSEIIARGIEIGKGIGVTKGSNVGATNPFPLNSGLTQNTGEETLEESNARIAKEKQKYNYTR